MAQWQHVLAHVANDVEEYFDARKYWMTQRLGAHRPIMIAPYRGFGTLHKVYLKGRVLENKGVAPATDKDTVWNNLVNMYRRFESDEIPHAQVVARFEGAEHEVAADEEGYFEAWLEPAASLPAGAPATSSWREVELELLSPRRQGQPRARAVGQVLIPPPTAQFGVISDVDDTVLQTEAAHLLRMARTVFLGNARTRLPFEGVAAFYRALQAGAQGNASNPLFYVSSSPWNIYDLISDFFDLQGIPAGPLLLRDWGLTSEELFQTRHRAYKVAIIRQILDLFPNLDFILLGDSGQEDPEIYHELVGLYPHRILAIYIRNVSADLKRPEAIRGLAQKVVAAGSTLILADNTLPLAEHAASQGWIAPETLPEIHAEKKADQAPPSPVEKLLGEPEHKQPEEEKPTVVIEGSEREKQAAIRDGAIEEALDSTGKPKEDDSSPPSVVVKGNKDE